MKILLIEDDEEKLGKVLEFLEDAFPGVLVEVARSFASGLRMVIAQSQNAGVLLLDMSMPSFDTSSKEPTGGVPEHFAGRELLAQMKLREVGVPTIVFTMFDAFGEKENRISLERLERELKQQYSPPFVGLIHYSSRKEGWRKALRESIYKILSND